MRRDAAGISPHQFQSRISAARRTRNPRTHWQAEKMPLVHRLRSADTKLKRGGLVALEDQGSCFPLFDLKAQSDAGQRTKVSDCCVSEKQTDDAAT
jgi:hypothetical protein